jgi:hypothetical protein
MRICTLGRVLKPVNAVDSDFFHNVTPIFRSSSAPEKVIGADSRVARRPSQVDAAARVINTISVAVLPHSQPDKPASSEPTTTRASDTRFGIACPPPSPHCLSVSTVKRAQADTETGQVAIPTCPKHFVNPKTEVIAYEENTQVEEVCNAEKGKDAENAGRCGSKRSSNGCERSHPGIAKADSAKTGAYGGAGATYPAVFLTERVSRRPALSLLLICEQSPRSPR